MTGQIFFRDGKPFCTCGNSKLSFGTSYVSCTNSPKKNLFGCGAIARIPKKEEEENVE